jgi:uncharacterized protein
MKDRIEREGTLVPNKPAGEPRDREIALTIHVSNACNLDCGYCYALGGDYGRETRRRMDEDIAIKAIEKMYQNFPNIVDIMFFGGEPLLAVDVIESICKYIDGKLERGEIKSLPKYKMVTNGTLIGDEAIEVIKKYKINLTISLDGPKEINDKLRPYKGGQGSFDAVKKGFYRVVDEAGQVPEIEATYTQLHREAGLTMERLIDFLHQEFLFTVGTVAYVDLPEGHPWSVPEEHTAPEITKSFNEMVMAIAKGEMPKMERSFLFPFLQFIRKSGSRYTCAVGHDGFDITTEGEIYPCQVFIGRPEFLMGTVDDFDYDNPSPALKRTLDLMIYADKDRNPICRDCFAKDFCVTCPGSHLFSANNYNVPEHFCTSMRKWVENVLGVLYDIKSDPILWKNFLHGLKEMSQEIEHQKIPTGPLPYRPTTPMISQPSQSQPKLYHLEGLHRA